MTINERLQRRITLAAVANLKDALTITKYLIQADLEPQLISVIGQEACFAGEQQNAHKLARIVGRTSATPTLLVDSARVVALTRDCDSLSRAITQNTDSFENMLLQWLSSEHAERLANVINRGKFLLAVEINNMVEERIATRILLRHCRETVEVHDVGVGTEDFRL